MRDVDDYLNKISEKELNNCETAYGYCCEKLLSLDKAVLSYALKSILDREDAPYEFRHIELLTEALRSGGSVDLGKGCRAVCSQGILRITDGEEPEADDICVPFPGKYGILYDTDVLMEQLNADSKTFYKKFTKDAIRYDIITDNTVVRHRRAGDVFTDPYRGVTKTLKKLFNELKIPREKRDGIDLIADGSRILYIGAGIGPSKEALVDPERDKKIYMIRWM